MSILTTILSPPFLVNNIELIAFVTGVMILVTFDDFVFGNFVFPVADLIKHKLAKGLDVIYEKRGIKAGWARAFRKYGSEAVTTTLIIAYCYIGYAILGIYVIEPIFQRWKSFILIVIIVLFLVANYMINNPRMRKRFFGVGVYNPDKN